MHTIYYKPGDGWAGDFIPFYLNGTFRIFYLHDWRDKASRGEGTPWYQISTADFVHFTEHGEMLARGSRDDQDLYVYTGSVIEAEEQYHIFYTGHNPHFSTQGRPQQAVMHAVSDDLLHWCKLPGDTFFAPQGVYEPHDWRDPFVFWNEEAQEYWMLLAARLNAGPSRRRGCTALCTSKDLRNWEVREPFWAPGLYYTHECPDLFRMGEWWYLVFSEFSEGCRTRYRISRSVHGPWLTPEDDSFDGRAFYAAKTASDGQRRYLFGWNPTREGDRDDGRWQWGGNLVVHELVQQPDGTLSVRPPESVRRAFNQTVPLTFARGFGDYRITGHNVDLSTPATLGAGDASSWSVADARRSGFACATAGALPDRCHVAATVRFAPGTRGCGLMLRVSEDLEEAYYIRLEPGRQRLVFDRWPRPGDLPFAAELERPLALAPNEPVQIEILLDGTVCEAYVAGKVAMSTRLYDLKGRYWGVFVSEGSAHFEGLSAATG